MTTDIITPELYESIRRIAWSRCDQLGKLNLFDDAVQEGAICAWQASQKEGLTGDRRHYMIAAARNGILQVLRGQPQTGEVRNRIRNDAMWKADFPSEEGWRVIADEVTYDDPDHMEHEHLRTIVQALWKWQKFMIVARFSWGESWEWIATHLPRKQKMDRRVLANYWHKELRPKLLMQMEVVHD